MQVFNEALYSMLRKALQDIVNPELALAWRSFNFDLTSPNILGLPFGHRPGKFIGLLLKLILADCCCIDTNKDLAE